MLCWVSFQTNVLQWFEKYSAALFGDNCSSGSMYCLQRHTPGSASGLRWLARMSLVISVKPMSCRQPFKNYLLQAWRTGGCSYPLQKAALSRNSCDGKADSSENPCCDHFMHCPNTEEAVAPICFNPVLSSIQFWLHGAATAKYSCYWAGEH